MTNELFEDEGDRACYHEVKKAALKRHSLFFPVILNISKEENIRRISQTERTLRYKLLHLDENYHKPLIHLQDINLLELEVSHLTALEAAQKILQHCQRHL